MAVVVNQRFEIARVDGRSNQQVLIDLVKAGEPGRLYSYDEIRAALANGSTRRYSLHALQSIVRQAGPRLLREHRRALRNVAGIGYKLAAGYEHTAIALVRRRKSEVQARIGYQVLANVRWDEMDDLQRKAHEGQLMIVGAMWQQMRAFERRMSSVEEAIRRVSKS